ncbi:MAG: hypothetical protein AAB618_03655 [Patescibacteria group bacterium]
MFRSITTTVFLAIFLLQVNVAWAEEPLQAADTNQPIVTANTCDLYLKPGSVAFSIEPSTKQTVPDAELQFLGKVKNTNNYPVLKADILARVYYAKDIDNAKDDVLLEQFTPTEGLTMGAATELPFGFTWHIPKDSPEGSYYVVLSLRSSDSYEPITFDAKSDVVGNRTDFTVENDAPTKLVTLRSETAKLGADIYDNTSPTSFQSAADGLSVSVEIENPSASEKKVPLQWSQYANDASDESQLRYRTTRLVTLAAGEKKTLVYEIQPQSEGLVEVTAVTQEGESKSIVPIRFIQTGHPASEMVFGGLAGTLFTAGGEQTIFSCLKHHEPKLASSYSLMFTLKDAEGNTIHTFEQPLTAATSSEMVSSTFTPDKPYGQAMLQMSLKYNGVIVEEATSIYDCSVIDPTNCPAENITNNIFMKYGIYLLLVVVIIALAIAIGVYVVKKRRSYIVALLFAGLFFSVSFIVPSNVALASHASSCVLGPEEPMNDIDGFVDMRGAYECQPLNYIDPLHGGNPLSHMNNRYADCGSLGEGDMSPDGACLSRIKFSPPSGPAWRCELFVHECVANSSFNVDLGCGAQDLWLGMNCVAGEELRGDCAPDERGWTRSTPTTRSCSMNPFSYTGNKGTCVPDATCVPASCGDIGSSYLWNGINWDDYSATYINWTPSLVGIGMSQPPGAWSGPQYLGSGVTWTNANTLTCTGAPASSCTWNYVDGSDMTDLWGNVYSSCRLPGINSLPQCASGLSVSSDGTAAPAGSPAACKLSSCEKLRKVGPGCSLGATTDLKINSSDGPVSVNKNSTLDLSWEASNTTLSSCTLYGADLPSGSVSVGQTGTLSVLATMSDTYSLQCGSAAGDTDQVQVSIVNQPPNAPAIAHPTNNAPFGVDTTFTVSATDPDNDNVFYEIDWDMDGNQDETSATVPSGVGVFAIHNWLVSGSQTFQARTVDTAGARSGWTQKSITIDLPSVATAVLEASVNGGAWSTADQTVNSSDGVALQWSSSGATDCSGTGSGFTPSGTSGSDNVNTPAANSSILFDITCTGPGGNGTDNLTITTRQLPNLTIGQSQPALFGTFDPVTSTYNQVTVYILTQNLGGSDTTSAVDYLLELDINNDGDYADPGETVNRSNGVGMLAVGNVENDSEIVTDPAGISFGSHNVRITIDSSGNPGKVVETTEGNLIPGDNVYNGIVTAAPPDPLLSILANPIRVQNGQNTVVAWSVGNPYRMSCSIYGPGLAPTPPFDPSVSGFSGGSAPAGPITAKSEYTIACDAAGTIFTDTVIVEAEGVIEEI